MATIVMASASWARTAKMKMGVEKLRLDAFEKVVAQKEKYQHHHRDPDRYQ